jgi:hypothetical protein
MTTLLPYIFQRISCASAVANGMLASLDSVPSPQPD